MKRLLTLTALPIVFGALYFGTLAPAHAAPSLGFLEGFTITDDQRAGDPSITPNLGGTPLSLAALALVLNTNDTVNLATFSPAALCQGYDCSNHVLTDPFTVAFTFKDPLGTTKTLTQGGTFIAKYNGALACVGSDPISQGQSDCVIWSPLSTTANNYPTLQSVTDTVTFGDGYVLKVTFTNAIDWNITPTVTFDVTAVPTAAASEPATIALLGFGLLGTLASVPLRGRRKTRRGSVG